MQGAKSYIRDQLEHNLGKLRSHFEQYSMQFAIHLFDAPGKALPRILASCLDDESTSPTQPFIDSVVKLCHDVLSLAVDQVQLNTTITFNVTRFTEQQCPNPSMLTAGRFVRALGLQATELNGHCALITADWSPSTGRCGVLFKGSLPSKAIRHTNLQLLHANDRSPFHILSSEPSESE